MDAVKGVAGCGIRRRIGFGYLNSGYSVGEHEESDLPRKSKVKFFDSLVQSFHSKQQIPKHFISRAMPDETIILNISRTTRIVYPSLPIPFLPNTRFPKNIFISSTIKFVRLIFEISLIAERLIEFKYVTFAGDMNDVSLVR